MKQPPNFEQAKNKRQKARAAGLDPNHWYAVEHAKALGRGKAQRVTFWGTHVAIYRDDYGKLQALEDRCPHRQLPLSIGVVEGQNIRCQYHGWAFDPSGRLADVAHDLFGMKLPGCRVRAYPIEEKYGLIWVFFGDAENAKTVALPSLPELDLPGEERWACVPIDFVVKAHHSMVIDNVSDFTHAFLHRRFKPFWDAKLTRLETNDKGVFVGYDTKVGAGGLASKFVDRATVDTNHMELGYEYPYQWSNTDGQIKHLLSVLPIDEQTTRSFFLFHFKSFKIPFLPARLPRRLMEPLLRVANRLHIRPLLIEDQVACEAEQLGYNEHFDAPIAEISPAVHAFQALTIKRWEQHLEREAAKKAVPASSLNRDNREEAS